MKMAALGSGSSGNATLIRGGDTCVLLDNGFTIKETVRRLDKIGLQPEDLDAIVVTHEHGDHISGVAPFARKYKTPVWMTHGTFRATRDKKIPTPHFYNGHESFSIGDLVLDPFPTPHDAAESCQFIFGWKNLRVATLTDLGCTTPSMEEKLSGLDALMLECNYDANMLRNGPYGEFLQARIRGSWGHLDNVQSAQFLKSVDYPGLRQILLAHISEKNNSPDAVIATLSEYVPDALSRSTILEQGDVSEWFDFA